MSFRLFLNPIIGRSTDCDERTRGVRCPRSPLIILNKRVFSCTISYYLRFFFLTRRKTDFLRVHRTLIISINVLINID